jgi:16S rRNA (cytosine967-C5)-methyltransferase
LNTRSAAAAVLVQVIGERRSLSTALESALPAIPSAQDRAFVQNLCYGVLRWYFRLEPILARLTRKPIKDAEIRLLALVGLYQLAHTRVKPHAAVAETVTAAGPKAWAKPLLNGILRSYQRERERLEAEIAAEPATASAHPAWLAERFRADWPGQWAELLARNNEPPPMALRVNAARTSRDAYLAALAEAGIGAVAAAGSATGIVLEEPLGVERLPGFAEGLVSVQDTAAQWAAPLLDLQEGQRVLDLGAAPGGKTLHILESCPGLAEVVAVDISPERNARIHANLARAGLSATVLAGDATRPEDWWDGRPFDRILVDAPCSATGVIRRHPDIKILRQPADIPHLADTQRRILTASWPLLAPGGLLVYATCSVLRAENEAVITAFLAAHGDARELPIDAGFGLPVGHGRQILTGEEGMDGFFYARVEKAGP